MTNLDGPSWKQNNWEVGEAAGVRKMALEMAATGQNRIPGKQINGTVTTLRPNWMFLLHLTVNKNPCASCVRSALVSCCAGVKVGPELGRRWALRNNPKNMVVQIAQKEEGLLLLKLSWERMPYNMWVVIGRRGCAGTPYTRRIPFMTDCKF